MCYFLFLIVCVVGVNALHINNTTSGSAEFSQLSLNILLGQIICISVSSFCTCVISPCHCVCPQNPSFLLLDCL